MKNLKSYIAGVMTLTVASFGFSSCQDSFDEPNGITIPVASLEPNTTIAEVKELMWNDADNYCDTVPTKADGSHIVIAGRVISSDFAGNCFKYIILQDETGALSFSINSYNLYLNYRRGQEIVVDLTGLHIGKYRGLEQVGFPSYNDGIPGYETSFMSPERFTIHAERNGLPKLAELDTIVVNSFSEIGSTPAELRKWQSQLVRFNNVEFVPNASVPTLSTYKSSGVTQQITDADGNKYDIRTSGYSNFWNMKLPEGRCDVVALMGYYINLAGTGGWQLTLIDANSIQNVGNPTVPKGSQDNPYDVMQAIALQVNSENVSGWVRGYIVGTVAPEVEIVTSNENIEWTAEPTLGNTLVIGQTPETKDIAECLIVALPQDSDLRKNGALRENPDNYGKQIDIKGTFAPVMGSYGITDNTGSASEYVIEGKESGDKPAVGGDGTEENPYNCAQIIAMNPQSTTDAVEAGVWVKGYIVGYYQDYNPHFEGGGNQYANILIADSKDVNDVAKCVCVQLVSKTDARAALNLGDNPGNLGAEVSVFGDVMKYNTLPGIKNTSNYKLGEGGTTPDDKPSTDPVSFLNESFTTAIPSNWTQVNVAGNKDWYWREFGGVGYATMTGYNGTAPFDQWLVSPAVDMGKVTDKSLSFRTQVNGYDSTTSKFEVYVMTQSDTKGTNTQLNPTIAVAPASGYSEWAESGSLDLSAFSGIVYIGFRYAATEDAKYATWCVTDVKLGVDGGTTPPDEPVTPPVTSDYKGDFNSFNGGSAKSSYGTYTNASGWTATNCSILSGLADGASEQNPRFAFIGDETTLAPTLNGKTTASGVVESPTLTGGCKTLTFNYGFAFKDTQCSMKIEILQGGSVVKEDILTLTSIELKKAYTYSLDVNVTGDFQIRLTNQSSSQKDSNIDRISVWNLTWTN